MKSKILRLDDVWMQMICSICIFLIISLQTTVVSSIKFGLISPIEVVEEWGCHNSEIRLTCSHLDSKIAILEATFSPNCSDSSTASNGNSTEAEDNDDDCIHRDLRRLSRAYAAPHHNHRLFESEAGRRFLHALRQRHEEDDDENDSNVSEEEQSTEVEVDQRRVRKRKRVTLRASLEELIVEYLRSLAPDSDVSETLLRRRKRRDQMKNQSVSNDTETDSVQFNFDYFNVTKDDENSEMVDRIESHLTNDVDTNATTTTTTKSVCHERRQRVTQLDRHELEKALQNDSGIEHNIRQLLNYRCSGKNHCSFVFADDHPFSILWNSGIVRIKYMCMESYRLNKYCGEHLIIANESPQVDPTIASILNQNENQQYRKPTITNGMNNDADELNENSIHYDDVEEPMAAALIHSDQSFHHLKILKPLPSDDLYEDQNVVTETQKSNQRKGIFSQDFKVLKVLPSNLDDFNDIEKIGNEFFFKTDEEMKQTNIETDDMEILTDMKRTTTSRPFVRSTIAATIEANIDSNEMESNAIFNENKQNETLRDIRSTSNYDQLNENEIVSMISTTETPILATQTSNGAYRADIDDIDENNFDDDYESEEDYAVEVRGRIIERKNRVRIHKSFQKTAIQQPLLQQGFIVSPGYPGYYVGDTNCSWRLTVPSSQRIRLTILDLNLRYEVPCVDVLEVLDTNIGELLFSSCIESSKPIEVLSHSSEIKITLKSISTFAYPKRGILIHYTALGCIEPSPPKNGRLVFNRNDLVKFTCDPKFVFPDTIERSRELYCTSRNTWNMSLPNCVEQSSIPEQPERPSIKLNWNQNESAYKKKMSNSETSEIVIPTLVIVGLLVLNAFILLIILRCRNKRKNRLDEMTQL